MFIRQPSNIIKIVLTKIRTTVQPQMRDLEDDKPPIPRKPTEHVLPEEPNEDVEPVDNSAQS
jgi:hypothetical protein